MGHGLFLNLTCDIEESNDKDMQHCHFLKSTCDIGDPPIMGPFVFSSNTGTLPVHIIEGHRMGEGWLLDARDCETWE